MPRSNRVEGLEKGAVVGVTMERLPRRSEQSLWQSEKNLTSVKRVAEVTPKKPEDSVTVVCPSGCCPKLQAAAAGAQLGR
jgi:hypothetical protein